MSISICVKATPQEYINEVGVLDKFPELLHIRKWKNLLFIHGEQSLAAAKPFLPPLSSFTNHFEQYNGECSLSEIARISLQANTMQADTIIGIGGGKVLDLAKAVANASKLPVVLIPTIAASCAAVTPLSVLYDDNSKMVRVDTFTNTAALVLVEPRIILEAPLDYLIAGIGDTLAKWYEGSLRLEAIKKESAPLNLSYYTALLCRDYLIEYAEQAIDDAKSKVLSSPFLKVIETIIFTAGLVGGFGERFAKVSGAHAFYYATTVLPNTHSILHGKLVAYGILFQLALEDKQANIKELLPFYQRTNLPSTLAKCKIDSTNQDEIFQLAEVITSSSSPIHLLEKDITIEKVINSLNIVEQLTNDF